MKTFRKMFLPFLSAMDEWILTFVIQEKWACRPSARNLKHIYGKLLRLLYFVCVHIVGYGWVVLSMYCSICRYIYTVKSWSVLLILTFPSLNCFWNPFLAKSRLCTCMTPFERRSNQVKPQFHVVDVQLCWRYGRAEGPVQQLVQWPLVDLIIFPFSVNLKVHRLLFKIAIF